MEINNEKELIEQQYTVMISQLEDYRNNVEKLEMIKQDQEKQISSIQQKKDKTEKKFEAIEKKN